MHAPIEADRPAIAALSRRFHVEKLEVFGAAARGGHGVAPARSDVDLLVTSAPEAERRFATLLDLKDALEDLLGLSADLAAPPAPAWYQPRKRTGEMISPAPPRDSWGASKR